jgi:hypothetical protein
MLSLIRGVMAPANGDMLPILTKQYRLVQYLHHKVRELRPGHPKHLIITLQKKQWRMDTCKIRHGQEECVARQQM